MLNKIVRRLTVLKSESENGFINRSRLVNRNWVEFGMLVLITNAVFDVKHLSPNQ